MVISMPVHQRRRAAGATDLALGQVAGICAIQRGQMEPAMSFLKSLFGRKEAKPAGQAAPLKSTEYKGFTIHATPFPEGGQQQLSGVIEKEIDGEMKSHRFIRADRFPGAEEAADFAIVKARQLIDEQGERLFK
ncbi:HlyU family transcriptional regulator [Bosea sp. NPDC003192]|jgi:hypothetical protein|uniref:HlyU family transcriptional regulator n=1 Tax=Bosea sp. NPDC003192 TaxID=3390551 RepID=UPI003CFDEF1C